MIFLINTSYDFFSHFFQITLPLSYLHQLYPQIYFDIIYLRVSNTPPQLDHLLLHYDYTAYQQSMGKLSAVGRQLVIDHFNKQPLALQLGATIQKIDYGIVWLKFLRHPVALQHHGTFHGGIVSYIADTAGGLAGISTMQNANHTSTTVELKINFVRPAIGDYLIGKGAVINAGKSLIVSRAEIFTPQDKLVAFMLQTNMRIVPKEDNQADR